MSGMEFGERDLMPGEAMTGKTEWEDALIKHGIQEAQTVQKTDDDLHQDDVERKEQMVGGRMGGRCLPCSLRCSTRTMHPPKLT